MGRVHAAAMLVLAPTVISAAMLVMADAAAITSTMARGSDNPRASITLNALNPFSSSTIIRTAVDAHVDFSVPIYIGAREMPLEFIALLNSGASIYLADSSEYMANMFTGQILTAEGVGWFASVQTGTRRTRARDTSAGERSSDSADCIILRHAKRCDSALVGNFCRRPAKECLRDYADCDSNQSETQRALVALKNAHAANRSSIIKSHLQLGRADIFPRAVVAVVTAEVRANYKSRVPGGDRRCWAVSGATTNRG